MLSMHNSKSCHFDRHFHSRSMPSQLTTSKTYLGFHVVHLYHKNRFLINNIGDTIQMMLVEKRSSSTWILRESIVAFLHHVRKMSLSTTLPRLMTNLSSQVALHAVKVREHTQFNAFLILIHVPNMSINFQEERKTYLLGNRILIWISHLEDSRVIQYQIKENIWNQIHTWHLYC